MPTSLTLAQVAEKNTLNAASRWIFLLMIVLKDPASTVVRLSSDIGEALPDPESPKVTVWDGQDWVCFPFSVDDYTEASGDVPEFSLSVSNVSQAMTYYMEIGDGGIGAEVTLYLVNTSTMSDPAYFQHTGEVLDASDDDEWAKFVCGAENKFRTMIPRGRVLQNWCRYCGKLGAYNGFKGARCGYAGAETTCNRTLARCRELGNSARFGGFPGVGRRAIYV